MKFLLLTLLIACASAPTAKKINKELFKKNYNGMLTYNEIKNEIKRADKQWLYGQYTVEAYPFTEALIKAEEKEKGKRNLDNKEKIDKAIKKSLFGLTKNTTCFGLFVETRTLSGSKFSSWIVKLEDSKGELLEIDLSKDKSTPSYLVDNTNTTRWSNSTIGCVTKKIDLMKGFSIHMIPQFKTVVENTKSTLKWSIKDVN